MHSGESFSTGLLSEALIVRHSAHTGFGALKLYNCKAGLAAWKHDRVEGLKVYVRNFHSLSWGVTMPTV